jgi:hypothetical protein
MQLILRHSVFLRLEVWDESDKPDMAIPKIPSQRPPHLSARRRPSSAPDYAKDFFWVALIIQGIYIAGVYKKIAFLHSIPIFLLLVLLPAIVFVVAKTWKSAFKYLIACSLVFPAIVILFLITVAAITRIKNPNGVEFLTKVQMSFSVGGTAWAVLLTAIVPSLILGALARVCWNYFRRA